jgi:glyoxylase-like metal-dependent hydrolase (beta-lactamase superfamily II)
VLVVQDHEHHAHPPVGTSEQPPAAERPRRQEQERATEEITEVAPGVLRMQLPIDMPGLGHVNCYVLEDGDGFALVDPGLPGPEPYDALLGRLALAGIPLARVHTVIVTHSHPDHFGGAIRLYDDTKARVVSHRAFRMLWDPNEPDDLDPLEPVVGGDEELDERVFERRTPWGGAMPAPPPDERRMFRRIKLRPNFRLDDADTIHLARRDWVAVHTPGHTEDHLCLFDPTEGTLLSGDHVLPTITPHIGGLTHAADPLQQFFDSLDRVAAFGAQTKVVLPAHGHPFHDLAARTEAIKRHHAERLDTLRQASKEIGGPASVMELSTHLFSPRSLGAMADSETYAHLEHLRLLGEAEVTRNGDLLEFVID